MTELDSDENYGVSVKHHRYGVILHGMITIFVKHNI